MTLLELIFALAIIAALVSFSWPAVQAPLDRLRLRRAAEQMRIACGTARSLAIEQSGIVSLDIDLASDVYRIVSRDATAANEVNSSAIPPAALPDGLAAGTDSRSGRLAGGVVFASVRSLVATQAGAATPAPLDSATASIVFQPDGSTYDLTIWLRDDAERAVGVQVRGLTGATRMTEVCAVDQIGTVP